MNKSETLSDEDREAVKEAFDRACWPETALKAASYALGARDSKCPHTSKDFAKLVRSFSTMDIVPESLLLPHFNQDGFDDWMGSLHASGHVYDRRTITASFICHAFNSRPCKNIPPFDCKLAIEMWAPEDYRAFLRWVIRPWRG